MKAPNKQRELCILYYICIWTREFGGLEIRRQTGEFLRPFGKRHERVLAFVVQPRQSTNQIANVGPDPEVAEAPDVYDNLPRHEEPLLKRCGRESPGVEREPVRQRSHGAADFHRHLLALDVIQDSGDEARDFASFSFTETARGHSRSSEAHPA